MKITFEKSDLEQIFYQHLKSQGVEMTGKELTVTVKGGRRGKPGAATAIVEIKPQEEPTVFNEEFL
jgi:hypothetical protein